ncbi:MAG: hypothetical protein OXN95_08070, partial [bacterium]|nr:hypothetical protein [bacterium]
GPLWGGRVRTGRPIPRWVGGGGFAGAPPPPPPDQGGGVQRSQGGLWLHWVLRSRLPFGHLHTVGTWPLPGQQQGFGGYWDTPRTLQAA